MKARIQCEVCTHIIGQINLDTFEAIEAKSFEPPKEGYPDPFHPSLEYEWLRCPMCNRRPFIAPDRDRLLLEGGEYLTRVDGVWTLPGKATAPVPVEETDEYAQAWLGGDIPKTNIEENNGTPVPDTHQPAEHEAGPTGLALMEDPAEDAPPQTVKEKLFDMLAEGVKPEQAAELLQCAGHTVTAEGIIAKRDEAILEWIKTDKPGDIAKRLAVTPMWVGNRVKLLNKQAET